MFDAEHSTNIEIILIDDIEKYLRKEKLSAYKDEDISRICSWFNENQALYGASQVLDTGVCLYCQELHQVYSGRPR
jgi:type I restriction-modification system DNA methylase subunit